MLNEVALELIDDHDWRHQVPRDEPCPTCTARAEFAEHPRLRFTSKDPELDRFYAQRFGHLFAAQMDELKSPDGPTPLEVTNLILSWRGQMLVEARRQEHFDYVIDGKGRHRVVMGADGVPNLLIPEIEVVS